MQIFYMYSFVFPSFLSFALASSTCTLSTSSIWWRLGRSSICSWSSRCGVCRNPPSRGSSLLMKRPLWRMKSPSVSMTPSLLSSHLKSLTIRARSSASTCEISMWMLWRETWPNADFDLKEEKHLSAGSMRADGVKPGQLWRIEQLQSVRLLPRLPCVYSTDEWSRSLPQVWLLSEIFVLAAGNKRRNIRFRQKVPCPYIITDLLYTAFWPFIIVCV